MALQDDLRAQLIKQFPAEVLISTEANGTENYVCPTCKRQLAKSNDKCPACEQVLKWDSVRKIEAEKCGVKTATISFEIPGDFVKSDCRKCPLSYIGRRDGENMYECPLNMRKNCPLVIE